jgi:hypothetical protein
MLDFLLGNKGKDIKALLSSSLKLFGERGIRIPSFRRFWLATFNRLYVLCVVLFIVYGWHRGLGIFMIPVGIFILFPAAIFYNVRMKACQAQAAYTAITRGSTSFQEVKEATAKVKWSLRFFAIAELLIATEKSWGGENAGRLARSLLSALETVFDVAEDLLLPAVVIEQKGISDVAAHLADLKKNVPAALTGAFGLDLFGSAISKLTWFLHLVLFALSVAIGLALGPYVPASIATPLPAKLVSSLPSMPAQVCLIPVFLAILISSLANRTLRIFVSSLKDIYFSVFYTSINRPLEIRQDLRESVTNYLTFQDASYSQSIKDTLAQKFPTLAAGPAPVRVTEAAAAMTIAEFFEQAVRGGQAPEQIRDFLKSKGYTEAQIQTVMERYKR